MTEYLGIDESYIASKDIIYVGMKSRSVDDLVEQTLAKRNPTPFFSDFKKRDFIFLRINNWDCERGAFHEMKAFALSLLIDYFKPLGTYIDGQLQPVVKEALSERFKPRILLKPVCNGDRRIPLLHQADSLAYLISSAYQSNKKIPEYILKKGKTVDYLNYFSQSQPVSAIL